MTFNGAGIPKSPYKVEVKGVAGDPSKCTTEGPGIQPKGNLIGKATWFKINTRGIHFKCFFSYDMQLRVLTYTFISGGSSHAYSLWKCSMLILHLWKGSKIVYEVYNC